MPLGQAGYTHGADHIPGKLEIVSRIFFVKDQIAERTVRPPISPGQFQITTPGPSFMGKFHDVAQQPIISDANPHAMNIGVRWQADIGSRVARAFVVKVTGMIKELEAEIVVCLPGRDRQTVACAQPTINSSPHDGTRLNFLTVFNNGIRRGDRIVFQMPQQLKMAVAFSNIHFIDKHTEHIPCPPAIPAVFPI